MKELIDLAKARPGELNYATNGVGSTPHLTAALFTQTANINMVHIPYKGGAPATVDLIAGQVQLGFSPIASYLPHIKSGKLRALAVSSLHRSPALPQVPAIGETGLSGFEMNPWFGVLAPAGTPSQIIAKLNSEIVRYLRTPEAGQQLANLGVDPAYSTAPEFLAIMRSDLVKWRKVITNAGIRGE